MANLYRNLRVKRQKNSLGRNDDPVRVINQRRSVRNLFTGLIADRNSYRCEKFSETLRQFRKLPAEAI